MQPVTIHASLVSLSSRARVDTSPVVEFTANLFSATPSAISYVNAVLAAVNKPRKIRVRSADMVTGTGEVARACVIRLNENTPEVIVIDPHILLPASSRLIRNKNHWKQTSKRWRVIATVKFWKHDKVLIKRVTARDRQRFTMPKWRLMNR